MKILISGGSGFIGTNLIDDLLKKQHEILNVDKNPPHKNEHKVYWTVCDILDRTKLQDIFSKFRPNVVVHMAARTDTDPKNNLDDYKTNTEGTKNILESVKTIDSVERIVITSTQFVYQAENSEPQSDEDYLPHTVYGESKVLAEQVTRKADLNCVWTIIRPTNVWGPWHLRYPYEFWKTVSKGLYFHPSGRKVIRSYGYVGNVVWQIERILESNPIVVNKKTFYVGDEPCDLKDWVNGFSKEQIGREVIVVPRIFLRVLGYFGDLLKIVGITFPITSSRFKSMTTSNAAPMQNTFEAFGIPPYSLEQGIQATVEWMRDYHPHLVKRRTEHAQSIRH